MKEPPLFVRKKALWIAALIAALAMLGLSLQYIRLSATPMEGLDISPSVAPSRWSFTFEDGSEAVPDADSFSYNGTDMILTCRTELKEELYEKPIFIVTSNQCDCVILLNDSIVYAPSGRYSDGCFSASEYKPSSASGQFSASLTGEGDRLGMLVQFRGDDHSLKHLPKLVLYPDLIAWQTRPMSVAAQSAFPAGMYFALALFTGSLFFVGFRKARTDAGLILLSFCSLSLALESTTPYAAYVFSALQWIAGSWFCSVLPIMAMGWMIWYRLRKKSRLLTLPLTALISIVMLWYLVSGWGGGNVSAAPHMNLIQSLILPLVILILLIAAGIDAVKGNTWFRSFFTYFLISLPVSCIILAASALTGGRLAEAIKESFTRLSAYHSFYGLCRHLCILLLILCFIHAVLDLIAQLARHDAQLQALFLREQYALENMELTLQSQDETRRSRHEMLHHLSLIHELLSRKEQERASEYVQALLNEVSAIPSDAWSDNLVVNAIAGRYLNAARKEGVKVTGDIRITGDLPLADGELCVLLTNMLENALEACISIPDGTERFILFRMKASEGHLNICCKNSTVGKISSDSYPGSNKKDSSHHGYGIAAMHDIIEKHNGQFTFSCIDGCFTVEALI